MQACGAWQVRTEEVGEELKSGRVQRAHSGETREATHGDIPTEIAHLCERGSGTWPRQAREVVLFEVVSGVCKLKDMWELLEACKHRTRVGIIAFGSSSLAELR